MKKVIVVLCALFANSTLLFAQEQKASLQIEVGCGGRAFINHSATSLLKGGDAQSLTPDVLIGIGLRTATNASLSIECTTSSISTDNAFDEQCGFSTIALAAEERCPLSSSWDLACKGSCGAACVYNALNLASDYSASRWGVCVMLEFGPEYHFANHQYYRIGAFLQLATVKAVSTSDLPAAVTAAAILTNSQSISCMGLRVTRGF